MIFFLYGPDTWRKHQKLQQIMDKFRREVDPSRMNCVVLTPSELDEETLQSQLLAPPFLARKRLIVLKNLLSEGRRKGLVEIFHAVLEKVGDATVLLVLEDTGKPKTWKYPETKKVWEYLEKHATVEEFKLLTSVRLAAAIVAQAKVHGLSLEKNAAALLAIMCDGDLGQSEQEVQKLTAYCGAYTPSESPPLGGGENRSLSSPAREFPPLPEGGQGGVGGRGGSNGGVVTAKDVKLLCIAQGEANIFDFLDALGNQDKKMLLHTLAQQLEESEPTQLLVRIAAHLRALLAMSLAGEAGARALNLHPFQIKKISAQLRHWDALALKSLLTRLTLLDFSIKRGLAADPRTQLTALLARVQ